MQNEDQEEVKEAVMKKVKDNLGCGVPTSCKTLRAYLQNDDNSVSKRTFQRYLKKGGFVWKRLKQEESRKEREYIKVQREEFL